MYSIPMADVPSREFDVVVEAQSVHLAFRWSPLRNVWIADVRSGTLDPIVLGRQIVSRSPIIGIRRVYSGFLGDFMVAHPEDVGAPGRDAWAAGGFRLYYMTEPEAVAFPGRTGLLFGPREL